MPAHVVTVGLLSSLAGDAGQVLKTRGVTGGFIAIESFWSRYAFAFAFKNIIMLQSGIKHLVCSVCDMYLLVTSTAAWTWAHSKEARVSSREGLMLILDVLAS